MTPLRMAIVVHGRFHAFDLARELIRRGHDVTLFTNYPAWAAERFDVPSGRVRSAWVHGAVTRALPHVAGAQAPARHEAVLHRAFGRWAARALAGQRWDVVHAWSGIAEESLQPGRVRARCTMLMRGSAHIQVQDELLRDEEARTGVALERPSRWMIARELREYASVDRIVVLSTFARRTFERQGYPVGRLDVVPLGVAVRAFRPPSEVVAARRSRILSGAPLRVLYAGALSLQKGLFDLAAVARGCEGRTIEFVLAGQPMPETRAIAEAFGRHVRLLGKVPQHELPRVYAEADLFLFPTIQDGYGMVLMQARAAGLPILCTDHCAGPDIVDPGRDGWVVPIRRPDLCLSYLEWADTHRDALASMTEAALADRRAHDWSEVAAAFEEAARSALADRSRQERLA